MTSGADPGDATKPYVVWDGLGLTTPHSGVAFYGSRLHDELVDCGTRPMITALRGIPPVVNSGQVLFIDSPGLNISQSLTGQKFLSLKPIFSSVSYRHVKNKVDALIYHGLSNLNLPVFSKKRAADRFVLTIHDLIPLITGGTSLLSLQMRLLMPRVVDLADAIIVPSTWTMRCLSHYFGNKVLDKISVVPNGTDPVTVTKAQANLSSSKIQNDILSVGRGEDYKRLSLILAVAKALPHVRFLLITDAKGQQMVKSAPTNLSVVSNVSLDQLREAYLSSRVFLHPSLYEGWCLPAADAIQLGLKVIYVRGTGIEEVCSYAPNRSFGLGPEDGLSAWVDATRQMLQGSDSQPFVITASGLPTWRENAEKTLKIYSSLI
jgi:glycosyltransferase involved in cell wall biosynthesis